MFTTIFSHLTKILLVAAVLIALWCAWLWQPARQVQMHQRHMLDAAQNRNWSKLNTFFDDDFRTPYGQDKTWALQQTNEVLRQFFALEILDSDTEITLNGHTGKVRTRLQVEGKGLGLAEIVKSFLNESKVPFEFTWKRGSWKPWDWRLVSVDHPVLRLSAD